VENKPDDKITNIVAIQGQRMRFLAHVHSCTGDKCMIKELCPYVHSGRCTMLYNFLQSLYVDWTNPKTGLGSDLNQMQLDRIGTHLMPLYYQLARFSLEITALDQSTYINKAGSWAAFPQFKEVREVMKQIRDEMKDLNLAKMWEKKFGKSASPSGALDLDTIMQHGRPNAYNDMVARAKEEEKGRKGLDGKATKKS